jgi:hypothetical protein
MALDSAATLGEPGEVGPECRLRRTITVSVPSRDGLLAKPREAIVKVATTKQTTGTPAESGQFAIGCDPLR